jgi:NDP-sugar pyrophosphorylase family protein
MNTIILAGGKGERLKPMTENIPKPMVIVKNKPILWYIIMQLQFYKISKINLAIGYKASVITNYIKESFSDLNINFFNDGDVDIIERIRSIVKKDSREDILILYGDTISDVNINKLLDFSKKNRNHSILTVWPLQTNFGVVEINDNSEITGFKEKPRLDKFINIGYFILRKELFKYLNKYDNYADFLTFCGNNRHLKAFVHDGEHFTVNNIVELEQAEKNLNKINIEYE